MGAKKYGVMFFLLTIAFALKEVAAAPEPLTVWIMPNGASPQETLEKQLKLFTQKTGIQTQVQVLDWGEAWNRISLALSGQQSAPDVLQLGTTWVPYFASRNEIKSLNSELDQIRPDRFVPVSWNTTHIDGDSIIYSVPWFIDVRSVLANKRVLAKNGITAGTVKTYEGFVEAVRKVNAVSEVLDDGAHVRGYAFPGKSDWNIPHNFAPWIWSNGGSFIVKDSLDKWHANILSEETLLGIARYLRFVMDSLVPPEALQSNTAQIAQQFNNGELAFIVNTSEIVMQTRIHGNRGGLSNARIGSDSVEVLPIPTGTTGSVSFIGGSNLVIPANNNRKEAKDLLLFLIDDENLDIYTRQIGLLPPSKKVLEAWSEDENYRVLVKALETGRTYVPIPEWGDLEQLFVSMFSTIWEQMEIPALYSEDKLYEVFKQFTIEINKKLNYPTTNLMTAAEFKNVWRKVDLQGADEKREKMGEDGAIGVSEGKIGGFLLAAVLIMAITGLVVFLRKRKK